MTTRRIVSACAFVIAAVWAQGARAQDDEQQAHAEMVEYTIQPGDTCPIVAQKMWGDASRIDMVHADNPQMGPGPHHLRAGEALRLHRLIKPRAVPDARLSFVRNHVDAFTPQQHKGQPMEPLMRGHRVSTQDESSAEVLFATDARLQLGEQTLVVILGSTRGAVTKTATALDTTLVNGSLRARLGELAGGGPAPSVSVTTPAGIRVALGTGEALVGIDPTQTTRLAVHHGQGASITASNQKIAVKEGFGSKASRSGPPTPPKPLPPVPVWSKPFTSVVFAQSATVDVSATYAPGTGVGPAPAQWHAQLARDARFNDVLVDAKVGLAVTTLDARNLAEGKTYFARVAAIDNDQFEGAMTEPFVIVVTKLKVAPGGTGQQGSLELPLGVFCGIDGAPLAAVTGPVPFRRGPEHKLTCASAASGAGSSEIAIPAESLGPLKATAVLEKTAGNDLRILFTITDAAGEVVPGSRVAVTSATPGATIASVREATAPGTYAATATVAAGQTFRVTLRVNGVDTVETPPIAAPDAPPAPSPRAESPYSLEAAVLGGVTVARGNQGVGPAVGVELAVRRSQGPWSASIGLRPGFEHYSSSATSRCEALPSPCAVPSPSGTYDYDFTQDLFTLGVPLTVRLGRPDSLFSPYAGVTPMLVVERTQTSVQRSPQEVSTESNARFAFHALLGAVLRTGHGAGVFVEIGERFSAAERRSVGDVSVGAFLGQLGFRFTP